MAYGLEVSVVVPAAAMYSITYRILSQPPLGLESSLVDMVLIMCSWVYGLYQLHHSPT